MGEMQMSTGRFGCGCGSGSGPCGIDGPTRDVLGEISVGCQMAMDSMDQIAGHVDDASLLKLIQRYRRRHEELEADAADLLRKAGERPPEPGMSKSAFAKVMAGVKLNWDESRHEAAKLLMDGCNMGIQSISEYMNRNPEASQTSKELAHQLVVLEEEMVQDLKEFL